MKDLILTILMCLTLLGVLAWALGAWDSSSTETVDPFTSSSMSGIGNQ